MYLSYLKKYMLNMINGLCVICYASFCNMSPFSNSEIWKVKFTSAKNQLTV
jgi:hypothetical protein